MRQDLLAPAILGPLVRQVNAVGRRKLSPQSFLYKLCILGPRRFNLGLSQMQATGAAGPFWGKCLRAAQGGGDVLVHNDPALGAFLENHGPAPVKVRGGALFVRDVRAEGERGPRQVAA